MTRIEYKPGDVEVFAVDRWAEACEWPDDTSRVVMRLDKEGSYWCAVKGDPSRPFAVHAKSDYLRPLLFIDPDDREQVATLHTALHGGPSGEANWGCRSVGDLAAALRSLLTPPPPPRPDEPMGLGAVVEDEDGTRWVRTGGDSDDIPWRRTCDFGVWRRWANITAPRVLSEGVS